MINIKKLRLKHIWILITTRCNLNCNYCFFKYRNSQTDIHLGQINSLLNMLSASKVYNFVLSGGEPLLRWDLTRDIIDMIKKKFKASPLSIQTNLLLISPSKLQYLKDKGVIIEGGIDGGFQSNFRHRIGITKKKYRVCLKSMDSIVKNNLIMNPTMTVHPRETGFMFENFKRLVTQGLHSIEIHPAFLAGWNKEVVDEFIRQYKKIADYERSSGEYLICKSYSLPMDSSFDLVIQPDGFVLPNWTFLSFPYRSRRKFFIIQVARNGAIILKENLTEYLNKLKTFFSFSRSYREFSNFNASLILDYVKDINLKRKFLVYKELCKRIQNLDLIYMSAKGQSNDN